MLFFIDKQIDEYSTLELKYGDIVSFIKYSSEGTNR